MYRNGLVFVPREPPKRVILYPTQDSSNQQQQQQINGFSMRPRTALLPSNNSNETNQQTNTNVRLSRQQPIISAPSSVSKLNEKSNHDDSKPNLSGTVNSPPKTQNPYYPNPFFRPKVVTNQSSVNGSSTIKPNSPPQSLTRESSSINTMVTTQTLTSTSSAVTNRGRQPFSVKTQNPYITTNGRTQESETAVNHTSTQDDNRHWAHTVVSASISRRTASDERPTGTFQSSETNISNPMNSDPLKQKGTSATDIVISLMDTWRAPINPTNTSVLNIFTRNGLTKDDSTMLNQTSNTNNQSLPTTPLYLSAGTLSTAANNNQNWKKALVANFQKNSRNIPTAKLFQSKQITAAIQLSPPVNNESNNQQTKPERTITFNGLNNERTFQANENTLIIPSLVGKTVESLRVTKQDNNNNNNVERSTSLQIQPLTYSNPSAIVPTVNKPEENVEPTETSTSETTSHVPIPIPSALVTAKPVANVEQQRAIITRVMIRRDFVKSTESKPVIPSAAHFRSFIPPQSARPGDLPVNNVVQVATITENPNLISTNSTPNRIHPFQRYHQQQQQQQQTVPLSQKSLISFTTTNPLVKESLKTETIPQQPQSNGLTNETLTSSSITKMSQSQTTTTTTTTNTTSFRSTSLSAANADAKKRREELMNKIKKRAISASAASQDG